MSFSHPWPFQCANRDCPCCRQPLSVTPRSRSRTCHGRKWTGKAVGRLPTREVPVPFHRLWDGRLRVGIMGLSTRMTRTRDLHHHHRQCTMEDILGRRTTLREQLMGIRVHIEIPNGATTEKVSYMQKPTQVLQAADVE